MTLGRADEASSQVRVDGRDSSSTMSELVGDLGGSADVLEIGCMSVLSRRQYRC